MRQLYVEACDFAYQICEQEGRTGGPSDHIWNTLSTGKFGELVVKECADVVRHINCQGTDLGQIIERKVLGERL